MKINKNMYVKGLSQLINLSTYVNCVRLFFLFSVLFVSSCTKQTTLEFVSDNLNDEKIYFFDYNSAYMSGFIVPSIKTDNIEDFKVKFKVNNFEENTLYYKVYFQNESYKFPELDEKDEYNKLSAENFYGSWEESFSDFDSLKVTSKENFTVETLFRISGNPRNEKKYYGKNWHKTTVFDKEINKKISQIKNDPKWYKAIEEKAKANNLTVDDQLKRDARWMLAENPNNKWMRNPRVGKYSILIVITNKQGLDEIPEYIKNISIMPENGFINPFYYFLYGDGKNNKNIKHLFINEFVTVKANVPLNNGIYVNYSADNFKSNEYFNKYVNSNDDLYKNATLQIHWTKRAKQEPIMNIPIHADFFGKGYTKKEYEENRKKYNDLRVETYFTNTLYPGRTFGYDENIKAVWFKNPGNTSEEFVKEDVGFKSRHGLTFGTYTFKIKMAELLTKDNVWTGLTNAVWMINETLEEWNRRRICTDEGYMPFYGAGKGETRVPQISYSEIDFEIVKAAEIWPRLSYKDQKERIEPESNSDKVMIACTNWDMACPQPENFDIGLRHIKYLDKVFNIHRWDEYYNALTLKTPAKDDDLFGGEYYYFQLEWKPTEIIWRVGHEKNKLNVVGYMNDKVTSIPNNQMLFIITQEFHFSKWWPKSPFNQEDIPFSKEDLKGYLYSVEIE
ncbi:MAG: hypothetical protein A2033_04155 [Bacteroidetes bacterium GWA2_31_9]|nr:MAG: hypothetical protein A2033_04155 [Bacteroidetes bacterium GWA2_31_9]